MQPERREARRRPREALRAADPRADADGEIGRAGHAAADRGQLRAGQVPLATAGQLAPFGEGSPRRADDRDRDPSSRPVHRRDGPGRTRARVGEDAWKRAPERRHARHPGELPERRERAPERDPRHAFRRALRGVRIEGLGRGPRQGAPRVAARLDVDYPLERRGEANPGLSAGQGGARQPRGLRRRGDGRRALSSASG